MKRTRLPFASYNLWLQFSPPVGKENLHCDMKRGFTKARAREPSVAQILTTDNTHQRIGLLAQRGVYEFHQDLMMLYRRDAVELVADKLELSKESDLIQKRVLSILKNYKDAPILLGKQIIKLSRGDEGFPEPILIQERNNLFHLYAAIDCIFSEQDGTLHILDFKTGTTDFDQRQAYVYLLAARYLYPQQKAIASFYNLENSIWSEPVTATNDTLRAFQIELFTIAQLHENDLKRYRNQPNDFRLIYPPNPGVNCLYCPFNSICQFSVSEVSP